MQIGVCSWSLQVTSIAELKTLMDRLGVDVVHIACGDPHHAIWSEGDDMPAAAKAAGFQMTAAMLGFPGEDYSTPQTIQRTGGFGPVEQYYERFRQFQWALARTQELGVDTLTFHAGFIPKQGTREHLDVFRILQIVGEAAVKTGVTIAFETGQESARVMRLALDELHCPGLKVNFDPANMLLYDAGDPLEAVELLGKYIHRVHAKDAKRPKSKGQWGEEVPLGQGEVDFPAFVRALKKVGYDGPFCIEREVGNQEQRIADISHGVEYLRSFV